MPAIDWLDWTPEALERAKAERKPVLLQLAAPWSLRCREMDAATWTDPEVLAASRAFVCVRVDADRRPDVNRRYAQGGWPTTAFLAPDGETLFAAEFLAPGPMLEAMRRALDLFRADGTAGPAADWKRREAEREDGLSAPEALDPGAYARVLAGVKADFDPEHGGFGKGAKYPLPESIELLLYAAREGKDAEALKMALACLRAMAKGLRDPVDGGFFRCCAGRDWSRPHHEKLLSDNARLTKVYLDAHALCGDPELKAVALETLGYLSQVLLDTELGGYRGSQAEDPAYYRLPKAERLKAGGPGIDPAVYCDANAMMVPALLKAAAAVPERREELEGLARRVLDLLETRFFDHHEGMFHFMERGGGPRVPGLLSDQAWTMIAFTEAFQYFMEREYREFADGLLRIALMGLWRRDRGGFWDRDPSEPALGREREPVSPPAENGAALEALWRLCQMKGIPNYGKWLDMGLKAVLTPGMEPHEGASLARLADIAAKGRLELDLIGLPEDPRTRPLLVGVYGRYLPRRIVSFIDPDDMDFILAHRLSAPRYPRLFVVVNGRPAGSGETLAELEPVLSAL